ncbi:MAG: hypothetical protein K2Q22_11480 [Cytophagales bacterium]|nr:hypothetical protein [Cytophagales bacterium]
MNPFRRTLKKVFGVVFINDRKDVRLMFNCFLAAGVFWLINAMNKEYVYEFKLPVKFSYDEKKFAPKEQLPSKITLELKSSGWNLFQKSFGFGLDTITVTPDLPKKQYITLDDIAKWSETGVAGATFEKLQGDSLFFKFITLN